MAFSCGIRTNMRTPYRPNRPNLIAALHRSDEKTAADIVRQRRKNGTFGLGRPDTRAAQDPRLKYQQYVTLAAAETRAYH